jgi:hypothetical protein
MPFEWTDEIDTLLGTVADRTIAKRFDIPRYRVSQRRREKGIPPYIPWPASAQALLGTNTDAIIAELIGKPESQVRNRRESLKIHASKPPVNLPPYGFKR